MLALISHSHSLSCHHSELKYGCRYEWVSEWDFMEMFSEMGVEEHPELLKLCELSSPEGNV